MRKSRTLFIAAVSLVLSITALQALSMGGPRSEPITPNQFKGSDSDRIEAAIAAAKGTVNTVIIPPVNASTGTDLWLIDRAILLPSDMTVVIDNCTIQLSDKARDNWFRSDNIGLGITEPKWNRNISIVGIGKAMLKGADNPRATGDYGRFLTTKSDFRGKLSYGTDAGKEGVRQKSDWRNIGILIAQVDGFVLRNVHIKDAHAWAISFERTHHAELSDLIIDNTHYRKIDGRTVYVANMDGIDLRQGNKHFLIRNLSGHSGDDFIALTNLDRGSKYYGNGLEHSMMLTTRRYRGPIDDIEDIHISNITCESACNGIAIRVNDGHKIHDVFIDGLYYKGLPNRNLRMSDPWNHKESMPAGKNAVLLGSRWSSAGAPLGEIRDIYAMNIVADAASRGVVTVKGAVFDTVFKNCLNIHGSPEAVTYFLYPHYTHTDRWKDESLVFEDMVTANPDEKQSQDFFIGPEPVKLSNFVAIESKGNAADTTGCGAVDHSYSIAKHAVCIAEWALFLKDDESGKLGSFSEDYKFWSVGENKAGWMASRHPAVNISLHQAAQYCNWLTTGNAIQGAYRMDTSGQVVGVDRSFRNADGILYALPSEDEWYKAAYFSGDGYSLYSNGSDSVPLKSKIGLTGWNYSNALASRNFMGPVQRGAKEQNGTCNMTGAVWEWLEGLSGVARGGAYDTDASSLASSSRLSDLDPSTGRKDIGFRVVAITAVGN